MEKLPIIVAKKFRDRGFSKVNIYRNRSNTVFLLNFNPGQQMPAHYHPGCELFMHVLNGNGTFTIDGKSIEATKDDVVHVLGTEKLGFTNTSDGQVSVYVTLCTVDAQEFVESC